MSVCLDIDADFIFRPRTTGNPTVRQDPWISPEDFVHALRSSGLEWENCRVTVFADHEQAYSVWKDQGIRQATLVHVDAHSDFYDTFPWLVHCGNFLRKAAEEGFLKKIVWVVPPWLYESGEWRKWDLPHLRFRSTRINTPSRFLWSHLDRKAEIEVVPLDGFSMPRSRVTLVTVATSPRFVPKQAFSLVNELVEFIIRDCSHLIEKSPLPAPNTTSVRSV